MVKRGSIGMALFTGIFVLITMLFIEYIIPDIKTFIKIAVVGLLAATGSMIGNKLFPKKQ